MKPADLDLTRFCFIDRCQYTVYVDFDVLYAHGEDLRSRPLKVRKIALKRLLRGRRDPESAERLSVSPALPTGERYTKQGCNAGLPACFSSYFPVDQAVQASAIPA